MWLMKAEPDSRVVKGKDVKFSVDDFERMKISPWDGVRNFEARNIMRDKMKLGDPLFFYHSNTKTPGVAAIAEVAKEGYPDHTAFDSSHPYFDPKSKPEEPKWYMIDVTFKRRLPHFVPLALLRHIASLSALPEELSYLSAQHLDAIKTMPLLNKGRLSVQPVEQLAWDAILLLGDNGGWEDLLKQPRKGKEPAETEEEKPKRSSKKRKKKDMVEPGRSSEAEGDDTPRRRSARRKTT